MTVDQEQGLGVSAPKRYCTDAGLFVSFFSSILFHSVEVEGRWISEYLPRDFHFL